MVGYLGELAGRLDGRPRGPDARDPAGGSRGAFVDYGLEYPAFVDCAQTLMRRPGTELLDEMSERALLKLGRAIAACLRSLAGVLEAGVRPATSQSTTRAARQHALRQRPWRAAAGAGRLVVKESAPGVPIVGEVRPEQVERYMVAERLALATR